MADLVGTIKDGVIQKSSQLSTQTNNNSLDKDAFLQLLVCQMKYQDPLNPSTDTEYVSQLATFSQLEQMQNLNSTMSNTQAFGLVGKDVVMKSVDSNGSTTYYSGLVDFVSVTNGTAYLSVGGNLYPASNLDTVIDGSYMNQLPQVQETNVDYNIASPADAVINISLGYGSYEATNAVVSIDGKEIESSYVSIADGKLAIKKEAFSKLAEGSYRIGISFNNTIETASNNKVKITVVNKKATDGTTNDSSGGATGA